MPTPLASVVVPAHNEETTVLRCLRSLLEDAAEGEFDVVVAANGCTDRTVELVRSSGLADTCLDLPAGGKIAALNAADAACIAFPRIYLDADVVLGTGAARALALDLRSTAAPRAAAPALRTDASQASGPVRAFYRVWSRLPVLGNGYVGGGVYAVNAAGHARIAPFPDVVNDDEYVRTRFDADERSTSAGHFTTFPARTVRALVRRSTRTRTGNREVRYSSDRSGAPDAGAGGGTVRALSRMAAAPSSWPDLVVFVGITALVRLRSRIAADGPVDWGRDETSRATTEPSA